MSANYEAKLGILVLDTGFPRILGDVGNPKTWPFPVIMKTVKGASPTKVTGSEVNSLLDAFSDAANELIDEGADGITTTCGFLAWLQEPLAKRCSVPVATSSLLQISSINALLPPGRRTGVITFSSKLLTNSHVEGVGAPADTPRQGLSKDSMFYRMIMEGHNEIDTDQAKQDVIQAGKTLVDNHPDVGAIVIECANMPPYSAGLRHELQLPVYDPYTFITWFYSSLSPTRFEA
ncbi:MAG: aspartate/glutamate racemase family protein [Gammaproteobacteria bacterium]|nr:aspartate/glutamate racemase family protein [Gammaproteobacteria bacterium]